MHRGSHSRFLLEIRVVKDICWNFRTMYGGQELSRNRVPVPEKEKTKVIGSSIRPWT
jgi:hypothetical protein